MIPRFLLQALTAVLPNYCLLCREPAKTGVALCAFCIAHLPYLSGCLCSCCALPLEATTSRCGRCLTKPPSYDQIISPLIYRTPIDSFVHGLKFGDKLLYADLLAKIFLRTVPKTIPLPEALIPVPLHVKRLRQRGFNQALEIAKIISKTLQIPVEKHALIRHKNTVAQATLKFNDRLPNIKNAFAVKKPMQYSHVALIDDVVTSGMTVNQCAILLKKHGVQRVDVWCMARTNF